MYTFAKGDEVLLITPEADLRNRVVGVDYNGIVSLAYSPFFVPEDSLLIPLKEGFPKCGDKAALVFRYSRKNTEDGAVYSVGVNVYTGKWRSDGGLDIGGGQVRYDPAGYSKIYRTE